MVELVIFVILGAASVAGALTVCSPGTRCTPPWVCSGRCSRWRVFYVVHLGHLVAAVQVIVYAGAVMTLFLFVIMMIGVDRAEDTTEPLIQRQLVVGLAAILGVTVAALVFGGRFVWVPRAVAGPIPTGQSKR